MNIFVNEYPKCPICNETPDPRRVNALIADVTSYDHTPFCFLHHHVMVLFWQSSDRVLDTLPISFSFSLAFDLLMANSILIVVYKHLREKSIVAPTVL
jgi:hypothetical protein